jgi:hypothetical protein
MSTSNKTSLALSRFSRLVSFRFSETRHVMSRLSPHPLGGRHARQGRQVQGCIAKREIDKPHKLAHLMMGNASNSRPEQINCKARKLE